MIKYRADAVARKEINDAKAPENTLKDKIDSLVIGGATYPTVDYYADLPAAVDHASEIYVVLYASGLWFLTRKSSGLYYSNGTAWTRLGNLPEWYSDANFEIYNSTDESKAVKFLVSGVTTSTTRTLTVPNKDGTIACTDDLHDAVTVSDSNTLDLTLSGQQISGEVLAVKDQNTSTGVTQVKLGTCTQAEYDALTPDSATLYFIKS